MPKAVNSPYRKGVRLMRNSDVLIVLNKLTGLLEAPNTKKIEVTVKITKK